MSTAHLRAHLFYELVYEFSPSTKPASLRAQLSLVVLQPITTVALLQVRLRVALVKLLLVGLQVALVKLHLAEHHIARHVPPLLDQRRPAFRQLPELPGPPSLPPEHGLHALRTNHHLHYP